MRRGLVGDDVDRGATASSSGNELGGVAHHADGQRPALGHGPRRRAAARRPGRRPYVQVAVLDAAVDGARVAVDADRDAVVHGDGQRLGAAHAAEAGGQRDRAGERCRRTSWRRRRRRSRRCPGGCPGCRCRSRTRPSSARTWSDPRPPAGGTPPSSPSRHQVGVGDSTRGAHSWVRNTPTGRPDWTSIVSSCSSVVSVRTIASKDAPVAGGLARAAVDDELLRVLGHLGVEIVLEHAKRGLLRPAPSR